MKVYPKQSPGCSTVGASAGAVNPKTHQKWVWLFIDALIGLMDVVVGKIICGDRCGNDIVLKCFGSIEASGALTTTVVTVPAAAKGLPFQ